MKIVIFGIGGAGRAIYRTLKDDNQIIAFIENNSSLYDTFYDDILIKPVDFIKEIEFDKIAISGVWIEEMKKQLLDLGVQEDKIWLVDDSSLKFSSLDRERTTDSLIKEFSRLMRNENISYFIDGSSLLCLLRNQDLSNAQDIDIMVKSCEDLNKIYSMIKDNKIFKEHQVIKVEYPKNTLISKKGELQKIVIKSNSDSANTEPVILDITALIEIKDYYFVSYASDYFLYYDKEHIEGENYFEYKGIPLLIPYYEDKFLELLYGKNWITPATKWSYLDYGNILNNQEFKDFIKYKAKKEKS